MVPDALGSVRAEMDMDLAAQASQSYGPYGAPFGAQGAFAGGFGYTGEQGGSSG
jgi:hypothetical protein